MLIPNPGLDVWNFETKIHFWAILGRKSQNCLFFLKIDTRVILTMLIFIPTLVFWISDPKYIFGQIGTKKSKNCLFCVKIGTHFISRLLILVPTLVFWISKPKSIFGQIWIEKLKVVQFGWKLAHRVSRRCWFLFRHYFSQFPTLNPFLDKFGPKNSKLFILTKNWHTWYIEDADSYSDNSFLNCQL